MRTMQGATKMHEEIFPLPAAKDPGRPPEEILSERSVQTEAQFHSHLPSQRAQSFQVRKYLVISQISLKPQYQTFKIIFSPFAVTLTV